MLLVFGTFLLSCSEEHEVHEVHNEQSGCVSVSDRISVCDTPSRWGEVAEFNTTTKSYVWSKFAMHYIDKEFAKRLPTDPNVCELESTDSDIRSSDGISYGVKCGFTSEGVDVTFRRAYHPQDHELTNEMFFSHMQNGKRVYMNAIQGLSDVSKQFANENAYPIVIQLNHPDAFERYIYLDGKPITANPLYQDAYNRLKNMGN